MDEPLEPPPPSLVLSSAECREISIRLADVLCWLSGFSAAKPKALLPPGISGLREFNIKLKGHF